MRFVIGRKAAGVAVILLALLCISDSKVFSAIPCCEGTIWLQGSDEVRVAYISGYMVGLSRGYTQGCLTGTRGVKASAPGIEADPLHKCTIKGPTFPQSAEEYAKLVTEFYQEYPGDRIIPITDVLMKLAEGFSLEQIHLQWKEEREGGKTKE